MSKFLSLLFCAAFVFAACSVAGSQARKKEAKFKSWDEVESKDSPAKTADYGEAQLLGNIDDKNLPEISGLVASQNNPDVFWVHNDSGDKARLFAVDTTGKVLAQINVTNAKNDDWEDAALGTGADGKPALYIADTGNNEGKREVLTIYRIAEPKLGTATKIDVTAEKFLFRYPDGTHDCEAIFINPQNEQIYLITKTMKTDCGVYRLPLPLRPEEIVTVEKVAGKQIQKINQLRLVTGASAAPDGSRVAIRTYFSAFELQREKGKPFETIFDEEPAIVSFPLMKQSEAISYSRDGKALTATSEKIPAPLYQVKHK